MRRMSVSGNGTARAQACSRSLVSQSIAYDARSMTGIALGCTAPTTAFASHVKNAMKGAPSPGRQMPAKANNGSSASCSPNHTFDLRLVTGSGSAVHSQKLVTGTRHRRSGLSSADRQNTLSRLRTLVTGRPLAAAGPGKPQVIVSSFNPPPSFRRSTGAVWPRKISPNGGKLSRSPSKGPNRRRISSTVAVIV